MSKLRAWLGRGAAGLPAAEPLDFERLAPPRSPNFCLAAPEGHPWAQLATPRYATPPEALFAALLRIAEGEARTTRRALEARALQAQWVQRSARANFPDLIAAEVRPAGEGAALHLFSRSVLGWSDMGVNRARLERWLAALARAGLPPLPAPAPPEPPSALAVTLAGLAAGRHVLLAADGAAEAPALLLRAAGHGAASARLLSAERPDHADWELRALGARLGLEAEALALLARGRVGTSPLPASLHARTDQPWQWWMREDWDAGDLAARLGPVDLVVEAAGLATATDPAHRLAQLRRTGARALLLRTLVPVAGAAPGFTDESLWHASTLDAAASAALDAHLAAQGLHLPQFTALPERMSPEAVLAAGLTDPVWWFMGEAALHRLLADAGWAPRRTTREGAMLLLTAAAL